MSRDDSSQKFIGRNRAPRVQIEYDVELYGAEKTVELPFVNAVLADLSGSHRDDLPVLAERHFLEIDAENFDQRMAAIHPQVRMRVANHLTGEGELALCLGFDSLEDFSPGAIARNVEPLRELLEARNQLISLLTYMDGKSGAEQLMACLLQDPALMSAVLEQDLAVPTPEA